MVRDRASAARIMAAAVQLLRSAGKCAWFSYCHPVQYPPPGSRRCCTSPNTSRARPGSPVASSAMTSSQVSAPVTHGSSLTQRTPRPGTTKSAHPDSSRARAAGPRTGPASTG